MALLRNWDDRWGADSAATSLAVFWGTELMKTVGRPAHEAKIPREDWVATRVPAADLLSALSAASARLTTDFGSWQTHWGQINRFQRVNDDIRPHFSDSDPSIPVPFVYSGWGSLASFAAHPYPGTKRWYGNDGNSFVAVVEFGPRIHAVAITAGGESGNPRSPHFDDEAQRYASGNLREVYFYPEQLKGHSEKPIIRASSYRESGARAADCDRRSTASAKISGMRVRTLKTGGVFALFSPYDVSPAAWQVSSAEPEPKE